MVYMEINKFHGQFKTLIFQLMKVYFMKNKRFKDKTRVKENIRKTSTTRSNISQNNNNMQINATK